MAGFIALAAAAPACASNERLSFRIGPVGHVYAVISGQTDYCGFFVQPPASLLVDPGAITITSPDPSYACGVPPPPSPYEQIADLGALDAARYDVVWRVGTAVFTGQVIPAAMPAGELDLAPERPAPIDRVAVAVYPLQAISQIAGVPASVTIAGNVITVEVAISTHGDVINVPMRTTLPPLASGTYTVAVVGAEGNLRTPIASREVVVRDAPESCTPSRLELLSPAFQLNGYVADAMARVVDDHGRPVSGATVHIDRMSGTGARPDPTAPNVTLWYGPDAVSNTDGLVNIQGRPTGARGTAQYELYFLRAGVKHSAYFIVSNRPPLEQYRYVPVVEYYNADLDDYFITADAAEMGALDAGEHAGWRRTGGVFLAYAPGTLMPPEAHAVCRYYGLPQAGLDSHFFSADAQECAAVAQRWPDRWALETPAAFAILTPNAVTGECPSGTQAVHRVFNGRTDANHRYFTDDALMTLMVAAGWIAEGTGPSATVMCAPL